MLTAVRLIVVGTTGSGKTTIAKTISQLLDLPHVEFDSFRHGPNWTETPDDLFRARLGLALTDESWVADGNYRIVRDIAWSRATGLVWLDYPIRIVLWRLLLRVIRRGITREELWNGNRENIIEHFFTPRSLFIWALKTHWRIRSEYPSVFKQQEYSHLGVVRLKSPKETAHWLSALSQSFQAPTGDLS